MRDRSSVIPPRTGVTWPSSEVPAPKGTTGTPCWWQRARRRAASSPRLDERDGVRQDVRLRVLAVAVLLAERVVGGDPLAEEVAGVGDDGVDGSGHGGVLKAREEHVESAGDFVAVVGQIAAGAAQFTRRIEAIRCVAINNGRSSTCNFG